MLLEDKNGSPSPLVISLSSISCSVCFLVVPFFLNKKRRATQAQNAITERENISDHSPPPQQDLVFSLRMFLVGQPSPQAPITDVPKKPSTFGIFEKTLTNQLSTREQIKMEDPPPPKEVSRQNWWAWERSKPPKLPFMQKFNLKPKNLSQIVRLFFAQFGRTRAKKSYTPPPPSSCLHVKHHFCAVHNHLRSRFSMGGGRP